MIWNWQLKNWPNFTWDSNKLTPYESTFALKTGVILGSSKHIPDEDKHALLIQLLSIEAVDTSLIEGEYLNRDSVQSSIKKALGLSTNFKNATPSEINIASMMVNLYHTISEPITHESLCHWQKLLLGHNHLMDIIGAYRTHEYKPWALSHHKRGDETIEEMLIRLC